MTRKRVTLAEVAATAGVSSTTASLVLSGRGDELRISAVVQERVRDAAAELSYRPNIVSRGLRQGRTRTLGFVSDEIASSSLAGDMIRGAVTAARERGFMLFIGESEGDPGTERALLDAMADRQVDGLVLASMFTHTRPVPHDLIRMPAVLLNTLSDEPTTAPAVIPDEIEAGRAAARLLLDAGHREIHLVGAGPGPGDVQPGTVAGAERLAGILETLDAAGLAPVSGHPCADWLPPIGWDATRALLAAHPRPKALICFNDRLAFGAYQALQEAGLVVPDDVSVVSFDDYPLASWLRPGLSSFAIPHEALGRAAVELLIEMVTSDPAAPAGPTPNAVHRIPMPVRLRESVATARAGGNTHS